MRSGARWHSSKRVAEVDRAKAPWEDQRRWKRYPRNDTAALIHPNLIARADRVISEALGVDVQRGTVAGLKTVGMAACATNKGVLAHPKATEGELSKLDDTFGVPVNIGNRELWITACGIFTSCKHEGLRRRPRDDRNRARADRGVTRVSVAFRSAPQRPRSLVWIVI